MHSVKAVTSLITKDSATIILSDGTRRLITSGNKNYDLIIRRLKDRKYDGLLDLLDEKGVLPRFFAAQGANGLLKLADDGSLTYSGQPIAPVMLDQIKKVRQENGDIQPLLNFLERLLNNPDQNSVNQFYKFIEANGLMIEPDGMVLAYKGVKFDYTDVYSGKFDNSPGAVQAMPRAEVDSDPSRTCSNGFHVGGWDYVRKFGDRKMVARFDPADVGAVPNDANAGKVRVAKYQILGEVDSDWFKANKITTTVVSDIAQAAVVARAETNRLRVYNLTLRTMLKPTGVVIENKIPFVVIHTDEVEHLTIEDARSLLEDWTYRKDFDAFPGMVGRNEEWDDYAIVSVEYDPNTKEGVNSADFHQFKVDVILKNQQDGPDFGREIMRVRLFTWSQDKGDAGIAAGEHVEKTLGIDPHKVYVEFEYPEK